MSFLVCDVNLYINIDRIQYPVGVTDVSCDTCSVTSTILYIIYQIKCKLNYSQCLTKWMFPCIDPVCALLL